MENAQRSGHGTRLRRLLRRCAKISSVCAPSRFRGCDAIRPILSEKVLRSATARPERAREAPADKAQISPRAAANGFSGILRKRRPGRRRRCRSSRLKFSWHNHAQYFGCDGNFSRQVSHQISVQLQRRDRFAGDLQLWRLKISLTARAKIAAQNKISHAASERGPLEFWKDRHIQNAIGQFRFVKK